MASPLHTLVPLPSGLATHQAVSAWREQLYLAGVRDGRFVPLVYPFVVLGSSPLLLYVLLPKLKGRAARLATLAATGAFYGWVIYRVRSPSPTAGFAIGVLSGWNILWTGALVLFRDAKRDFKRVNLVEPGRGHAHRAAAAGRAVDEKTALLDGHGGEKSGAGPNGTTTLTSKSTTSPSGASAPAAYVWQPYPAKGSVKARLGWFADLVTNFRGVGWNWRISGIPSRPPHVEASLRGVDEAEVLAEDRPVSSAGRERFRTVREALRHNAWLIVAGYAGLDLLKTIINRDPYFWGLTDRAAPAHLPALLRASPLLTHVYRVTVIMTYLWLTLRTIFAVPALVYMGVLGRRAVGSSGEAWVWPDQFGSYRVVFERGLAGFWGGWWHQIFRYGFQSGGRWLASDVLRLKEGSPLASVVQLSTSFNLSGLLHAAASVTMLGDTRPVRGSAMFFILQPVGIISGLVWSHYYGKSGVGASLPAWVGRAANFAYANGWIFLTAPFLADDLVRGGMLLGEPVPFSLLRGLGLGGPGDGFFCWQGNSLALLTQGKWWMRGISI